MSIMSNLTQKEPERAFALQKYLILHSQHDALQKRLEELLPSLPPADHTPPSESPDQLRKFSFSSATSSTNSEDNFSSLPQFSYRNHHRRNSSSPAHTSPLTRSRTFSLPTVVDEATLGLIEEDEWKLKDVNQQIKATLTELLNCESVKSDRKYRMWVQSRLMEAEKELKDCKSRSCERKLSYGSDELMGSF